MRSQLYRRTWTRGETCTTWSAARHPLALGLATAGVEALADPEDAIAHLRAALSDGAVDGSPGAVPDEN
jgi:hypothetical protein